MQQHSLDFAMQALSDPTRRAILDRLSKGAARVTELATPFAISLNAVSKHIKVLESAGIVHQTQQGREHMLELDAKPLPEVACWASRYEQLWNERIDRLESHFKKERKIMKLIEVTVSRFIAGAAAEVCDVWLDPSSPGCPW